MDLGGATEAMRLSVLELHRRQAEGPLTKTIRKFLPTAALTMWALQTAAPTIATYFPAYPNHIRLGLALATVIFATAVLVIRGGNFNWGRLVLFCAIPITYSASLIGASYFGVDFQYSVKHLLYTVPVFAVLEFAGWFLVGATFSFRQALTAQVLVSAALGSHMLWMLVSGADNSRLLGGLEFAGGASAGAVSGFWPVSLVLLILPFFSMKKIAVVATGVGWLVSLATMLWLHGRKPIVRPIIMLSVVAVIFTPAALQQARLLLAQVAPSVQTSTPSIQGGAIDAMERTLGRFEENDPTRDFLDEYSSKLLAENFPRGIGYFSFERMSADKISYTTFTADNEALSGVSLHNTYVFLLLEGGALTALVMLVGYGAAAATLWNLAHREGYRGWAAFLFGWTAACMVYAYAHQLHETPYLFGLMGMILGVWASAKESPTNGQSTAEIEKYREDIIEPDVVPSRRG